MSQQSPRRIRVCIVALLVLLVLALNGFENVNALRVGEHYTCRGVQQSRPWGCIGATSEFLTSDVMVFVWVKWYDITRAYKIEFHWSIVNELGQHIGRYFHTWNSTDPKSKGDTYWDWDVHWDYIPINTADAIGKWIVSMSVNDKEAFELEFAVKRDTSLVQRTETVSVSTTLESTRTSTATTTTTVTSVKRESLIGILPFPLEMVTVISMIVVVILVSSYSAYRWAWGRRHALRQQDEALAGYLAKLEEMRSRNEISQITYERLREEYWTRMRDSPDHQQ